MFRGRYEHTIDAKGRTSLPARYRDALAGMGERRIVITNALDPCLNAYAMPKWMEFEEKIAKGPRKLPPHTSAHPLALFFSATLQGMSAQARDGASREELEAIARTALCAWPR